MGRAFCHGVAMAVVCCGAVQAAEVQVAVGDKLAKGILSGEIRDGDEVLVGTLPDGSDLVLATA